MKANQSLFLERCYVLLGVVICCIGTHSFVVPADIAPGGATGVGLMIYHLTGLPVGTATLMVNLPLLVLAWLLLSRRFAQVTALTCVVIMVIMDLIVAPLMPQYQGDRLLCSLYGGVLVGCGMAMVFLGGSTTGGSDIVGYLLQKKKPHVSMGRALMIIDGMVLSVSILVFQDVDAALFGLIALYTQNKVIDAILYGSDVGSQVSIITGQEEKVVACIIQDMDRGATILEGKGGYSGKGVSMVICAVRKSEFSKLKRLVHGVDPMAFMMVSDTSQVYGEGFKQFEQTM